MCLVCSGVLFATNCASPVMGSPIVREGSGEESQVEERTRESIGHVADLPGLTRDGHGLQKGKLSGGYPVRENVFSASKRLSILNVFDAALVSRILDSLARCR